jgi:hypothetical protein
MQFAMGNGEQGEQSSVEPCPWIDHLFERDDCGEVVDVVDLEERIALEFHHELFLQDNLCRSRRKVFDLRRMQFAMGNGEQGEQSSVEPCPWIDHLFERTLKSGSRSSSIMNFSFRIISVAAGEKSQYARIERDPRASLTSGGCNSPWGTASKVSNPLLNHVLGSTTFARVPS